MRIAVLFLLTFIFNLHSDKYDSEVIEQGFKSIIQFDTEKSIKEFFKESVLKEETDFIKTITKRLNSYKNKYGEALNYSLLKTYSITKYVHRSYYVIAYEKAPVYVKIDLYDAKITGFYISINLDDIIPAEMYIASPHSHRVR